MPRTSLNKLMEEDNDVVKTEKKKFAPDDPIPCMSITAGEMFFTGAKTGTPYTWADYGYVVDIDYQDINYAVRSADPMVMRPRFVIQDKDFLEQNPQLDELYSGLYSVGDLKAIANKTPAEIEKTCAQLPIGAKDALKSILATMVANGTLDSVNRIKAFDKALGTELLVRLVES